MRLKLVMWEKTHGFKANYVAEKIGISPSAWSKIKAGKQNPTPEQIEMFRNEFGVENALDLFLNQGGKND